MTDWGYALGQVALAVGMVVAIYVATDCSGKREQRRLEQLLGVPVHIRRDPTTARLSWEMGTGPATKTTLKWKPMDDPDGYRPERYDDIDPDYDPVRSAERIARQLAEMRARPQKYGPPDPTDLDDYGDLPF